jgi:hypothetical protein
MKRYTAIFRLVAILALGFSGVLATAPGANATVQSRNEAQTHLAAATMQPLGPSGCFGGNWCTYNTGGGTNLCEQMDVTGNLTSYCASNTEASFNNTSSTGVSMFAGINEGGAYYFLAASNYLLYEADNTFNQCTNGTMNCGDYGGIIAQHIQSVQFN